jgi:hypothetical protein
MKNKNLRILIVFLGLITAIILIYFSPLNSKSIDDFTADNLEDSEGIAFDLRMFAQDSDYWTKDNFDVDNWTLFGDYGSVPIEYRTEYKDYNDEFEVFYGNDGNYMEDNFDYSMYFSSNRKNIRLIGYYNNDNQIPNLVILRTYPFEWYSGKYSRFGNEYRFSNYDDYFNKYTNRLFDNFKEKGFLLKKTKLKNGTDILIKKKGKYFLVIRKRNMLNSEDIGALEFKVYSERKISIP